MPFGQQLNPGGIPISWESIAIGGAAALTLLLAPALAGEGLTWQQVRRAEALG